jgi:hypothetical protein
MNLARLYAQVFGIVLTLTGIISFVPAIQSPAPGYVPAGSYLVLGLFAVNPLHNVVHLLTGLIGLYAGFAAGGRYARWYALVFGVVYAIVTVVGIIQVNTLLGLIPINTLDDVLHGILAVLGLGAYFLSASASGKMATA